MEVKTHENIATGERWIMANLSVSEIVNSHMAHEVLSRVAQAIADRFVEEHYIEIAAKLDQNAIANLAIAEASKKIAEEIERHPTVIHEKGDTQVYQRGILGGVRRIL